MRIKFLCSFGGKISDGPSGGNLVYVGGITKVIRLSNGPSWQQLREKTMALYRQPHTIKYQLPGEDLDVLVSVHCDEDLRHMMRFGVVGGSAGSEKLFRLFLFAGDSTDHPNVEVQHSNTSRVSAESKVASGSSDCEAPITDVTFSDPPSSSMSGNSELNHAALVAPDDKGTVSEEKVGESLHVDDLSAKVEENLRATVSENEESAIEEVSGLGGSVAGIVPHGKLDLSPAEVNSKELESEEKPQKFLNEKQQEYQDMLNKCISCDLGFSNGRPIAACVIYKCLLHWRSFEVERTSVFDRIIQTIGTAIEAQDNSDTLSYWLSNSSSLLLLLHRTLKASGAASMTPQRRRTSSASLFSRISQGLRASPQSAGLPSLNGRMLGGLNDLHQVEAKYPALLFKQQLTALLEKIYGMLRDNLKKELSPLLGLCIQAPRISRASLVKGSRSQTNAMAQQASIAHWQSIVKSLTNYLKTLQANYVPPFLVRKLFIQIFSFINVQLFNSLLLRRECCLLSNGEYVKAGLAELLCWCYDATEEYAGSAWDELKHIRQAVGFLVIREKPKKTLKEITNDLCPVLSIQQLYRICTMYCDDVYGTHSVSSDVISTMRVLMTEDSNNALSSSFLLDDDSSIPFSVYDISKSMEQIDTSDIDPPPLLRENSGFSFLLQRAE